MKNRKGWQFLVGVMGIFVFVGWLVPLISRLTSAEVLEYVQQRELDTGALFYTDSPAAVESEFQLRKQNIGQKKTE